MPYDAFLEIKTYGDANLQGFKAFIKSLLAHERGIPGGALLINHTGPQTPPRSPIPWYQIYQTLNEVSMRQHAEAELIEYKDQLEIKVAQRTAELSHANAELQKTINEIKTLKGTIPICMDCKEIRDDKGSWSQLEKYISEHSEAEFSHGICDSCIEKRYPDTED